MSSDLSTHIMSAVDNEFEKQLMFTSELSAYPSTRGHEQDAQQFIADSLIERGYEVDSWSIDVNDIAHLPGFSPVIGNYDNAINVVGSLKSQNPKGKSLILNGHIDVVPEGPLDMWNSKPYEPHIDGGYMYGRGTGDMKAGLVANIFAVDALRSAGYKPAANIFIQSVVEEECTGNGALACMQRGYSADAAIIPEPFNEQLISAQIGVIWFQVHLKGLPVHVATAGEGFNAIEAAIPLINALKKLETKWNKPKRKHQYFQHLDHPLNLNIGRIQGGDWPSSVPSWCCFDVRMAIYPGQDIEQAKIEIEACLKTAANETVMLKEQPPQIVYHGFLAEGYSLADHVKQERDDAIAILEQVHHTVTGNKLISTPITATTDARFFGLYADIPALVYGPIAHNIHGFNECVDIESVRRITQSIALFIADWCGLEPYSK